MSNDVNEKIGTVKVADDVVPNIAALAAAEVDGVVSVAENLTAEIIDRMGMRKAPKGVKVEIKGKKVYVDMALGIDYGYNVPETRSSSCSCARHPCGVSDVRITQTSAAD